MTQNPATPQPKVNLGKSSIAVTPLGIGTWAWGDKLFWSYGKDYGADQVAAAFTATLEAGINWFDTAEVYGVGESENLLGKFIKENNPHHQEVLIATKYMPLPWRFTASAVSDAVQASLDRLRVDRLDLYQVHSPFAFLMSQETLMNALADEVQRGRIGAIGVSNYSATQMKEAYGYLAARGVPLAVNQVNYSLLERQIESNGIWDAAQQLGVTILAYSPLAQGLVTGKYSLENYRLPEGARRFDNRFSKEGLTKIAPVLEVLRELGRIHDRTPAQVALNWLICRGAIPIPGAKNAQQVQENAGALGWNLTAAEVSQLDEVSKNFQK